MLKRVTYWQSILLVFVALTLGGCAAALAPSYDKELVDGLISNNTAALEFLASLSLGTTKETFESQRKEKYSIIIGRFDGLAIQAGARPVPKNNVTEAINGFLSKRGASISGDTDAPSAHAIAQISVTFSKMRNTDAKQGLTVVEVQAFKNQVVIYMDQALTYERFLER